MKKVKLQLPTGNWDDLTTKFAPDDNRKVDQNAFTDGTKNIDTETDGTIRKMAGGTEFTTLTTNADDQYEAVFSDGVRHMLVLDDGDLSFTAGTPTMTSVTTGYSSTSNFEFATTKDRVYMGNGVNSNQVYDKTASYGGVGYSVPQTKVMGAQVPGSAATAALSGSGNAVPVGGHTYKITFLYYDAQESNGSAASNLVTVTGTGEQVDLTSVPTGGYGVTARKVYRDDNDGVYVLVGTISDNTTTTYTDLAAGGTTPLPLDNGIPPIFGQVELFLDRLWMGQVSGEPFTLYFSEVGLPDIVESTNFIDCNPGDPITAIVVYRGRLVVFNRRSMGQIMGTTKDTFRYEDIQKSIGCVDTRTVQEIVLQGVPVLAWLSDQGFYGFNGSSIFYLSEKIEDLINVNIKQAVIQKNQQVHTTDTDFNAGTASDGIDVAGGQISVRGYVDGTSTVGSNPRRTWNDTADWDGGDSLDNVSTIGRSNAMQPVEGFSEEPATEGTKDNVIASGIGVTLPTSTDFTGESNFDAGSAVTMNNSGFITAWAQPFIAPRAGTLTSADIRYISEASVAKPGGTSKFVMQVWRDNSNEPGTIELTGSEVTIVTTDSTVSVNDTFNTSIAVSAGERIWIGGTLTSTNVPVTSLSPSVGGSTTAIGDQTLQSGGKVFKSGSWIANNPANNANFMNLSYLFVSSAIAASGTWASTVHDTQSESADVVDVDHTSSFPAGTGATTRIEAGDALDFSGNIVVDETQDIVDLSGTAAVTLGVRRYWQTKVILTTADDRIVPTVSTAVTLGFSTTAEWISDSVDTTGDSTTYDSLVTVATTPGSSTAVAEIRTAATEGALGAAPWVAFGSVTVRKFAQIRITMTTSGSDLPSVTSTELKWTIVSNLVSSEIDTNVDPAGWDVFQTDFALNGGTVVFEMRSATTSGGLPGATWYTVTQGNFPTASLPTEQFVQWRATLTASDTNVPTVSSVTIEWRIEDTTGVRAASIFLNKNYYIALAEFGNDENNVIVQLDANGKWRLKRGLGVSTFGYFFNDPYFGQSDAGVMGKFLEGLTDLGTNIEIDIRTRAMDYSSDFFDNSEVEKIPESILIEGRGTGATYDVSYSLDNGLTFTNFIDITDGGTTFTTTNDNLLFSRVFRAADASSARTIMYRVHTDDEFDIKLHRIKATAFITRKEPIITG